MSLPSASATPPCGDDHTNLPPSRRENIDVYRRISDTPGFEFFALAMPMGERPVKGFADTAEAAVQRVKNLLDVGWSS